MSKDARHRREAVRRSRPRARAARVRSPRTRGISRGPSTSSRGRSATSCSSPIPTSTTTLQEVADGRSADRARPLQARRPRRALEEADERRQAPARARRRRAGRQRLRRRTRGRADLRLPVREGGLAEARPAAVAELDDHRGDQGRVRRAAARGRAGAARGGRALALRGRLDRRDERDPRGDDPPALARSTARSRSGACRRRRSRSSPAARRRSAPSSRSRTGSSTRTFDPLAEPGAASTRAATTPAPTRGIKTAERGRRDRRRVRGPDRRDHQAREVRAQGAPAAAVRPHLAAARRQQPLRVLRAAHAGAPRSGCTRSTRR